ncbi:MAG: zf-HC2 domain-containing protein [Phycisphaerae bacterium]|jgi:anti-sigma factor RsiW
MDCKAFRKYIGAFADGELEVEPNLEALEHLNMCPPCSARVNAVGSLKTAMKRAYGDARAPERLRRRVLAALDAEVDGVELESPVGAGFSRGRSFKSRVMIPLGMAAALTCVVVFWKLWPARELRTDVRLALPGQVASDVRSQHRYCIGQRGGAHNDDSLPHDLKIVAERLSARLHMKVIAPDLSAMGLELVGADSCGVKGRPGAHVVYKSAATGKTLSVFTVGRWEGMDDRDPEHPNRRGYFVSRDDDQVCVVAWHEGDETYLVCSDLPESVLMDIGGLVSGATASAFGVGSGVNPFLAKTAVLVP